MDPIQRKPFILTTLTWGVPAGGSASTSTDTPNTEGDVGDQASLTVTVRYQVSGTALHFQARTNLDSQSKQT